MKGVLVLLALVGASLAADSCPSQCQCSMDSSGGTKALCSTLDAAEQQFPKTLDHLEVCNIAPQDGWLNTLEDRLFEDLGLLNLQSITISNTSLKSIDINAFRGVKNLFTLVLSDNKIEKVDPDTFEFSKSLRKLVLAGNPLKPNINRYFLKSETLTELDLSRCNLTIISPEMFSKLDNLLILNLASNNLENIEHFWENKEFEFIEVLNLAGNRIRKIDTKTLSDHSELSTLNLRRNLLESFDYVDIPELETLDLSQNRFQFINANTFKNVPEVINVNLSYNEIHFIAEDSFIHVPNLKHLDLSHNKMKGPLPVYMLQKNKDIETLNFSGNPNLKVLTGEEGLSGQHSTLYTLDISQCGLEILKRNSFQRMENIAHLNVSGNALRMLDGDVFSKLRRLNLLDLSSNQLLSLNNSLFSANTELHKLIVTGNPLHSLSPKIFLHLHHLVYLDASNCQLSDLWSFRDSAFMTTHKILSKLEYLNLKDNEMRHLHVNDFTSLQGLITVEVRGNPLQCTKHFTDLIQWFISNQIDPEIEKNELATQILDFDNSDKVIEKGVEWKDLVESVCPASPELDAKVEKFQKLLGSDVRKVIEVEIKQDHSAAPIKTSRNQSTLIFNIPGVEIEDASSVEEKSSLRDYILSNSSTIAFYNFLYWLFVFCILVLIMAICNLCKYWCSRSSPTRPSYIGPVGGYIRTKNDRGSLYYKLYEECSVPNPIVKNKTVVLDFNQFLKKPNSYNKLKDIDTLPSQV